MKLTYTLTLEDFKAGIRLHKRQRLGRRIHFFIYDVIFPSFAMLAILGTIIAYVQGQSEVVESLSVPDAALLAVAILVPLLRTYRTRKAYRQLFPPARLDRNWNIDLDDERIAYSVPGVFEGKLPWSGVLSIAQDDRIASIYITETQYFAIPLSVLSAEQHAELNDLIARHLPKGKK